MTLFTLAWYLRFSFSSCGWAKHNYLSVNMQGLEQEITLNAAVEQETAWRKRGEKNEQTTHQNTKQKIPHQTTTKTTRKTTRKKPPQDQKHGTFNNSGTEHQQNKYSCRSKSFLTWGSIFLPSEIHYKCLCGKYQRCFIVQDMLWRWFFTQLDTVT